MADPIFTFFLWELGEGLKEGVARGVEYIIRKVTDSVGDTVVQIVEQIDNNGDGVIDQEVVLYTMDIVIPDLSNGYCICNKGDKIGIGYPEFEVIDGTEMPQYTELWDPSMTPRVTGNGRGYLLDMDDDDKKDEPVVPLPDMNGDGVPEWGWLTDDDDNGVPDASGDAPFYPVGSEEYTAVIQSDNNAPSIIVMSPDGTMSVYDTNGQLTAEDCDTAYSLWVSENGIMNKPLDNYSVTEGILFIGFWVGAFALIRKIFRRKRVG